MGESRGMVKLCYTAAFCVLTLLCWCPIGYGTYGEVGRIFGIPSWAAILLALGVVLFMVEWVYLFFSDFALYDENLAEIMDQLGDLERRKKTVIDVTREG